MKEILKEIRTKKDRATDQAQCYACAGGEIATCSNCLIQLNLERIEALEKEIKMDSGICLKDQLGNLYVRMKSQEDAWDIRTKVQQELEEKYEDLYELVLQRNLELYNQAHPNKPKIILSREDWDFVYDRAFDGCTISQSQEHLERIKREVEK